MERNILFLCTGNSARSQMGEAFLKKHAGDHFNVHSAGIEPAEQIFPPVIEAMKEIGIDISDQNPKGVEYFLGRKNFEKVIIVCSEAEKKCPRIFGFSQRVFWPFEDPSSAAGSEKTVLDVCRKVRDEIDRTICEWLKEQGIGARPVTPAGGK
mgnify:CR=1 FL=1